MCICIHNIYIYIYICVCVCVYMHARTPGGILIAGFPGLPLFSGKSARIHQDSSKGGAVETGCSGLY